MPPESVKSEPKTPLPQVHDNNYASKRLSVSMSEKPMSEKLSQKDLDELDEAYALSESIDSAASTENSPSHGNFES